jgi:tetratricopeptide (TPR) repeat protein
MCRIGRTTVPRPRIVFRRLAITIAIAACAGSRARIGAQTPACTTPECLSRDRLWVPAAQIHELKNEFVTGVRQFTEAVAGTFGDEGPRLSSSLELMSRTLERWDAAIRAYESMIAATPDGAERHLALGTVYLDRERVDDAFRELSIAATLDPRRVDVAETMALAGVVGRKPLAAADALRRASALDPANPITLYRLAHQLVKAGANPVEAASAFRRFHESAWSRLRTQSDGRPAAPFERVSLLRQVAGVSPIFPPSAYRAGFASLIAGQYAKAIDELGRAAAVDPLAGNTALAEPAAALRRGQVGLALGSLDKLAADGAPTPATTERLRALGVALWVDGQFERAMTRLREAVRLSPRDERSRLALADVLTEAGRIDEAERAFAETIAVIPESGQAHYRLALLHQSRSHFPEATRELESGAALNPLIGLDRLYETLGGVYSRQASFDSAVAAYVARIDANPNNAEAHKSLGEIYLLQGRTDEALAEFAVTVLIDPKSVGALVGASQAFSRIGQFDAALDLGQRALALDARLKDARYAVAMALLRLGRADEGRRELAIFERMQAEMMADAQRQSELNTIRRDAARSMEVGDHTAAVTLLRRAVTLDPGNAGLFRDLGAALMRGGHPDEAAPAFEKAVQHDDTIEVRRMLADAYKAAGRAADSETQAALAARLNDRAKAERLQKLLGAR